jgi:hypothetical protein
MGGLGRQILHAGLLLNAAAAAAAAAFTNHTAQVLLQRG